jgi:ribosomal protein S1
MPYEGWRRSLEEHFPVRDVAVAELEWTALQQRLCVGQCISGLVVAKSHFGAWLDIHVGFPALLLIPDIAGLTPERYHADDWCPVGSTVTAEVVRFNDADKQIRVSQGKPHESIA